MALSGLKAALYVSGEAVTFTDEVTTTADDTVYQITAATKRVWDPFGTIVVENDGTEVDEEEDPYTINRLTGTITFESDDDTRVITVSGKYLPMALAATAKSYSYSVSCPMLSDAAFGSTWDTPQQGLKSASGSIGRWATSDAYFTDAIKDDTPVVLQFYSNSAGSFDFRFWAMINSAGTQGSVDSLIDEGIEWSGYRDADGRVVSA